MSIEFEKLSLEDKASIFIENITPVLDLCARYGANLMETLRLFAYLVMELSNSCELEYFEETYITSDYAEMMIVHEIVETAETVRREMHKHHLNETTEA